MHRSRVWSSGSSRRAEASAGTAYGSLICWMFCPVRADPIPPLAELFEPLSLGELDLLAFFFDVDFLREHPSTTLPNEAVPLADLLLRGPFPVPLEVHQRAARFLVVRVQRQDSFQVDFALGEQGVLATPLGQRPLVLDRVRVAGPDLLVLDRRRPWAEPLVDLPSRERDLAAALGLDRVGFARRLIRVQQLADHAAAAGEEEHVAHGHTAQRRQERDQNRQTYEAPAHGLFSLRTCRRGSPRVPRPVLARVGVLRRACPTLSTGQPARSGRTTPDCR